MAYHDDLLRLASDLVARDGATQADLRRAVSTAYYALFHLLVSETTLNWKRNSSRNALGRMFDHGMMKRVSDRVAKKTPFAGEDLINVSGLRLVAKAFVDLQDWRHTADYDNGKFWNLLETIDAVARARSAFIVWNDIKHTDIAQEYLVSLLIRPRD
jgi:uncharacterized protein (UPF0332 family)